MQHMENVKWLPGQEPEDLQVKLRLFFTSIDLAFPNGIIDWEKWNHKAWDTMAVSLCRDLGYSKGAAFLTAYGYSILYQGQLIEPRQPEQDAAKEQPAECAPEDDVFTGQITKILPYNNSGFVRQDGGRDYYFNVRDFTHRVELREGLRVYFSLAQRMDHKRGQMRMTAVKLTEI